MYLMRCSIVLAGFLVSACATAPLEVRVLPAAYEVGAVRSELATPAVDEAVRQGASAVHIWACTSTPPRKVHQFRDELVARHNVPVTLALLREGCA